MKDAGKVICLYGVLSATKAPNSARAPRGLPGAQPPRLLSAGEGLWLVVADLPLSRYGEAQIERGLGNLDWVSQRAMAHEAVVEHFAALGPLAPAKLFTLFSNEDRALADVRRRARQLRKIFERIRGRDEWGVRLRLDRVLKAAPAQPVASGAAFLRAKRDAGLAKRRAAESGLSHAEGLFKRFSAASDGAVRRAVPARARVLLDAVFLVPRAEAKQFRALAKREAALVDREGLDLVLTGPWPPYHFAGARP